MLWKKDPNKIDNKSLSTRKSAPSVIADDMNILGNLISDGYIDVNGHVEGNVKCQVLVVRENGMVKGDVFADSVTIHGQVAGLIKARHVSLGAKARVRGVIMHESLAVEDGAFIDGQCKRTDRSSSLREQTVAREEELDEKVELIETFRVISNETR